jgi:hypothetical protein
MDGIPPFDYQTQAALAYQAHRDFKNFISGTFQKIRTAPTRDIAKDGFREFRELRQTPAYSELLEAFNAAVDAAYPPGFFESLEELSKHSDTQALEMAVTFLEADPYFFRSGYIKQYILRYVRGYLLSDDYIARLERVLLHAVDNHYCREFREYRKLAHRIDNPRLRAELQIRVLSQDQHVQNRAGWILTWLEELGKTNNIYPIKRR